MPGIPPLPVNIAQGQSVTARFLSLGATPPLSPGGAVAEEVHRKLEGIAFARRANGCPVLAAAMAWLECRAVEFVPAGDHTLVTAEVMDGQLLRDAEPLTNVYTGWPYSG